MSTSAWNNNHSRFDYAIVGGGCFGASTALALKREWPDTRIIWFEGSATSTASKDINKIIRTPYPDEDYVAFAERAMRMWEEVPPYRNFFHRTSWVQVISENSYRSVMKGPKDRVISTQELLQKVGSREKPKLNPGEELWLNEDIGYVDSALAVAAVAEEASTLGVIRETKDVTGLIVNEGVCLGVEVDCSRFIAGKTIIAAGAWTPGLLESSKVEFPDHFFTVAGVGVATMPLHEAEFSELKSMPILVTESGEIMPSEKHQVLKITTTGTFQIENPDKPNTNTGPTNIELNRAVLERMLPQFAGRRLDSWICPDLMTPHQHPLVDQAPKTRQLYLATGGSYHSFKFLPNFGDMVVRRLRGQNGSDTLEDRLLKRWVWGRSKETIAVHKSVIPKLC